MRKLTRLTGMLMLAASAVFAEGSVSPTGQPIAQSDVTQLPPVVTPSASNALADEQSGTQDNIPASAASATDAAIAALTASQKAAAAAPAAPAPAASADTSAAADSDSADKGTSVSATQVNVSDTGLVEMHVNDASLPQVLRMLSLQSQKNIIASKDVTGTVTANLYDVTVHEALDAILKANGYVYQEKGNFIYVYTAKEMQAMQKANRKVQTEVFRVHYTPVANVVNMIKPVLSTDGQVAFSTPAVTGIDTSGSGSGNTGGDSHATEDTLVVTDYPDNLEKIGKIIKQVDRRPEQILIEATIMRTTLDDNNSLGVNFSAMGGVDFNTLGNLGTTATAALSGAIFNGTATGSGTTGSTGSTGGTTGGSTGTSSNVGGGIADKGFGGGTTGFTLPSGGLNVGLVTNNIGVFLSALESATNTTVMANPKLLVLNKQQGAILVGQKLGYITTTNAETTSTQTVNFLDVGVHLIVRPFIGDDGYIRMEIHPEDSTGVIDSNGVPQTSTAEVTSNVMIKDGRTIVIGGLFQDVSSITRSQVPLLGDIPIIGALFRSKTNTTQREEIIVLLTPHIVKDDQAYSDASEEELQQAEKLRVGIRKNMMPFGRERLAECEYEKALKELKKPDPDRHIVLWHLNAAIGLNPTFSEAINLKESVTGKVVTDVDNSTIRSFVKRQIMREEANPTTQPVVPWAVPITLDDNDSPLVPTQLHLLPRAALPSRVRYTPVVSRVDAAPTTRPAEVASVKPVNRTTVASDRPATQPTEGVMASTWSAVTHAFDSSLPTVAQAPTTRPAVAAAPTTEPSVADANTPTTQPAVAIANEPTTRPTLAEVAPTTQPTVALAPTTQPAVASVAKTEPAVAVTPTTEPAIAAARPTELPKNAAPKQSEKTASDGFELQFLIRIP